MVTKTIWHTNNTRKTTRRRDFWKYTVALEGVSALIWHSSAYRSVKHICHAIRLSTKYVPQKEKARQRKKVKNGANSWYWQAYCPLWETVERRWTAGWIKLDTIKQKNAPPVTGGVPSLTGGHFVCRYLRKKSCRYFAAALDAAESHAEALSGSDSVWRCNWHLIPQTGDHRCPVDEVCGCLPWKHRTTFENRRAENEKYFSLCDDWLVVIADGQLLFQCLIRDIQNGIELLISCGGHCHDHFQNRLICIRGYFLIDIDADGFSFRQLSNNFIRDGSLLLLYQLLGFIRWMSRRQKSRHSIPGMWTTRAADEQLDAKEWINYIK